MRAHKIIIIISYIHLDLFPQQQFLHNDSGELIRNFFTSHYGHSFFVRCSLLKLLFYAAAPLYIGVMLKSRLNSTLNSRMANDLLLQRNPAVSRPHTNTHTHTMITIYHCGHQGNTHRSDGDINSSINLYSYVEQRQQVVDLLDLYFFYYYYYYLLRLPFAKYFSQ